MPVPTVKNPNSVLAALEEFDSLGRDAFLNRYGYGRARRYFLKRNGRLYDSKAILGVAHGYENPRFGPLTSSQFSGGEATVQPILEALGFEVRIVPDELYSNQLASTSIAEERSYRKSLWRKVLEAGGPDGLNPTLVRDLGIHRAQHSVWADAARTRRLTGDEYGVTVAVRHHGNRYPDDLGDDVLLYHYPRTRRPGRDAPEILATKNAMQLQLPIFVVIAPESNRRARDVRLAWVEDFDDEAEVFLVTFGDAPAEPSTPPIEDEPFQVVSPGAARYGKTKLRPGQQRFKFNVMKRYGSCCAVCDVDIPEVIDAAHLHPKEHGGSDDPRNGLPLCALHHRAMDAGLFAIDPASFRLVLPEHAITLERLRITRQSLDHLPRRPHPMALTWRWKKSQ